MGRAEIIAIFDRIAERIERDPEMLGSAEEYRILYGSLTEEDLGKMFTL